MDYHLPRLRDGDRISQSADPAALRLDLEQKLTKLQVLSNEYYARARQIGVHAFIEFAGLMNEMINIYRQSMQADIDYSVANQHSGIPLKALPYQVDYLAEKLECMFAPFARMEMKVKKPAPERELAP